MKSGAILSDCRKYRYVLWRQWGDGKSLVFIGLNPSTADETNNDRTISRCIDFAKRWGYDKLVMLNLFAYRTPYPNWMKRARDPIGPDNDRWLRTYCRDAGMIIAAWGADGSFMDRENSVCGMLRGQVHCLGITKHGHPRHPLYMRGDTRPKPYTPRAFTQLTLLK